ncbi:MAG: hypothetical protein QXX56_05055, partial [Candidatus Bathyarchaeia archaeon]
MRFREASNPQVPEGGRGGVRCARCLAEVSEGLSTCPKCGGSVFSGSASEGPLRNVLQLYSTPLP